MGIGIDIKSPFNNNDKPADKLIANQTKNSIFANHKGGLIIHGNISPIIDDDYCTCERCPHCGKKIRRQSYKPLMYGGINF